MLFYQKRNNTSALGRKFAKDENITARQGINCAILLICLWPLFFVIIGRLVTEDLTKNTFNSKRFVNSEKTSVFISLVVQQCP